MLIAAPAVEYLPSGATRVTNIYFTETINAGSSFTARVSRSTGVADFVLPNPGGANSLASRLNVTRDMPPTMELSTPAGTQRGGFQPTATISESVTGFDAADVTVTNCSVLEFSSSGACYTFTVIPSA